MNYSTNYNLNKPERNEQFNLDDWNNNTDAIDTAMNTNKTNIANNASNISTILTGLSTVNTSDTNSVYYKLMKLIYPVGSLYWSSKSTNPASLFGGTWVQIKDRFILACGDTYTSSGATGGSATVQLTESNLPAHTHGMNHHHYTSGTTGDNNRGHTHKFTPSGSVSSSFSGITHKILTGGSDTGNGFFKNSTNTTAGSKIRWTYGTEGSWDTSSLSDSVSWKDGGSVSSSFSGTKSNTEDISQNHTHTWGNWSEDSCTTANNSTARSNTDSTGSGTSFSVLPPYVVKYCWERTA